MEGLGRGAGCLSKPTAEGNGCTLKPFEPGVPENALLLVVGWTPLPLVYRYPARFPMAKTTPAKSGCDSLIWPFPACAPGRWMVVSDGVLPQHWGRTLSAASQ